MLKELYAKAPDADIRVWSDRKFFSRTQEAMAEVGHSVRVQRVASGKIRRYHSLSIWRQLLRVRTIVLPNVIDMVKMLAGIIQSSWRFLWWRPDVIFCKGGFVSVPVGLAARLFRIPVVLHDSDTHPGLANRVLSRWASAIGTGASLDHYNYPAAKAKHVGIPIKEVFRDYSNSERQAFKQQLGFSAEYPLLVVTGGGLGAQAINNGIADSLDKLLETTSVLLLSGDGQYKELAERLASYKDSSRFQLHAFLGKEMLPALASADAVVARAGATTLLELAALGTPTILIPSPYLVGGHQLTNAAMYEKNGAALVVDELKMTDDTSVLTDAIIGLLADEGRRQSMSKAIKKMAFPDAARDMADMILAARKKGGRNV